VVFRLPASYTFSCQDLHKMNINYTYSKLRREFGKQCRFSKCGPTVLENLMPDPSLEEQWLPQNPINKSTNNSIEWAEHEVS